MSTQEENTGAGAYRGVSMTKEEALQFKARWAVANEFAAEEARRAPASLKLRQLVLMYEAAQKFGWGDALAEGEEEVRGRWRRLKEMHNGQRR